MLPKTSGDKDRQNQCEMLVDALIRETNMGADKLQQLNKMIQELNCE